MKVVERNMKELQSVRPFESNLPVFHGHRLRGHRPGWNSNSPEGVAEKPSEGGHDLFFLRNNMYNRFIKVGVCRTCRAVNVNKQITILEEGQAPSPWESRRPILKMV